MVEPLTSAQLDRARVLCADGPTNEVEMVERGMLLPGALAEIDALDVFAREALMFAGAGAQIANELEIVLPRLSSDDAARARLALEEYERAAADAVRNVLGATGVGTEEAGEGAAP